MLLLSIGLAVDACLLEAQRSPRDTQSHDEWKAQILANALASGAAAQIQDGNSEALRAVAQTFYERNAVQRLIISDHRDGVLVQLSRPDMQQVDRQRTTVGIANIDAATGHGDLIALAGRAPLGRVEVTLAWGPDSDLRFVPWRLGASIVLVFAIATLMPWRRTRSADVGGQTKSPVHRPNAPAPVQRARPQAYLAHEIRTPLSGLKGFLALLDRTPLSPCQKIYLEVCSSAVEHLSTIVSNELVLPSSADDSIHLAHETFELRKCLEDGVIPFATFAFDKGLQLSLNIDPALPRLVIGDRHRITQIVANLVNNAVKFTESGKVCVRAIQTVAEEKGTGLEIVICDTGPGIAEQDRTSVFEPYRQLRPRGNKVPHQGSGLGLAICRTLATLMGGSLSVTSGAGGGCRFSLKLTLSAASERSAKNATTDRQSLEKRALLLSHDQDLVNSIQSLLGEDSVFALCLDAHPSLGLALAHQVRQNPALVCVLVDGSLEREELETALAATRSLPSHIEIALLGTSSGAIGNIDANGLPDRLRYLTRPPRGIDLMQLVTGANQVSSQIHPSSGRPGTAHATPAPEPKDDPDTQRPLRTLVADDDAINRKLARILLEQLGASVDEVEDGEAAVEACDCRRYDLVLMDVHMPNVGGIEATRRIRCASDETVAKVPIIALTADLNEVTTKSLYAHGVNGHIAKPIAIPSLLTLIRKLCPDRISMP